MVAYIIKTYLLFVCNFCISWCIYAIEQPFVTPTQLQDLPNEAIAHIINQSVPSIITTIQEVQAVIKKVHPFIRSNNHFAQFNQELWKAIIAKSTPGLIARLLRETLQAKKYDIAMLLLFAFRRNKNDYFIDLNSISQNFITLLHKTYNEGYTLKPILLYTTNSEDTWLHDAISTNNIFLVDALLQLISHYSGLANIIFNMQSNNEETPLDVALNYYDMIVRVTPKYRTISDLDTAAYESYKIINFLYQYAQKHGLVLPERNICDYWYFMTEGEQPQKLSTEEQKYTIKTALSGQKIPLSLMPEIIQHLEKILITAENKQDYDFARYLQNQIQMLLQRSAMSPI